ncbi:MAG: hypothetical protein MI919_16450, partial [Holophagales bacterium]|nr:hypothetical protein [Holophagales bacterium]
ALRLDGSLRDAGDIDTPRGPLINTDIRTANASLGLGLVESWGRALFADLFLATAGPFRKRDFEALATRLREGESDSPSGSGAGLSALQSG